MAKLNEIDANELLEEEICVVREDEIYSGRLQKDKLSFYIISKEKGKRIDMECSSAAYLDFVNPCNEIILMYSTLSSK